MQPGTYVPAALISGLVALAACGPVSRDQAERECFDRARLAQHPRGEVFFGAGGYGPRAGLDVTISSDFLQGRDPAVLYDTCVRQRSGQPPSQPLYTRPDWKG